jgi:hypothetical protein
MGRDAAHLGGEGRIHRRLAADDADVGLEGLGRRGDAADQAAAADRHRQDLQVGGVFQHLQGDRALARHDVVVVERVDEGQALFFAQLQRVGVGVVIGLALDDHRRAEIAGVLHLHERRGLGHDDGHGHAQASAVISQALGMVAGAGGDDALGLLGVAEQHQLVERAALLVGGRELQVLELHPHLGAGNLRQGLRIAARRALDMALETAGGGLDGGEVESHGGSAL